jgi:adenylate cyclase
MAPWQIRIYENQQLLYETDRPGPLELGRQDEGEDGPYAQRPAGGRCRLVIARREEQTISRRHALLEPGPDGKVRLTNLSTTLPIRLGGGGELRPGAAGELPLPLDLTLGRKTVRVQEPEPDEAPLQSLSQDALPPGPERPALSLFPTLAAPGAGGEARAIVQWLRTAMGVFQSAASSPDFFDRAARAVVDMVGLDAGRVLLFDGAGWQTRALYTAPAAARQAAREPSRRVLGRVRQERRTFWELPAAPAAALASLQGVTAVVAAPILDRRGAVIGALYGDRRQRGDPGAGPPITDLQALLVELLASGVAAGLARLEQERAALAARVRFEQFFTPELSHQLDQDPDLLRGRDAEVTVLFCDICDFSRLSERLGGARTVEWVGEVLGALSECVLAERGVVVEYIGDELMAMWGAPAAAPDHAARACRAALAMLARLPALNERWAPALGEAMGLGIGLHSGPARVGMIGSQYKFKYGPLGHTANLASRVQGATRYLKAPVLLTRATREQLGGDFAVCRLCSARLVSFEEPADLYELGPGPAEGRAGADWAEVRRDYEKALERFEGRHFRTAVRILTNVLNEHPADGPSLVLLLRAGAALAQRHAAFDPVWDLPGK